MCGITVYTGSDPEIKKRLESVEFAKLNHRGPDNTTVVDLKEEGWLGFHRLSIIDVSDAGNQPLINNDVYLVCNGEIYNYPQLREQYIGKYNFIGHSDCEVIIPMYLEYGMKETAYRLDAEFACVIYDSKKDKYLAARDPIGIRPLFYGYTKAGGDIMFSSEFKTLHSFCDLIKPFPPGHYYEDGEFHQYRDITVVKEFVNHSYDEIYTNIREKLIEGVRKRLQADVPVGYLLSGGLDSSLVCAIVAKILDKDRKLITFSVGIIDGPIDTKYARIVADYIGSDHHEVLFTKDDIYATLHKLIGYLETWDITTVRASVGMYLLCKYIKENTDVKVLLSGEISDELFGYKYTDFAPSPEAFQEESVKRVNELYMYDVLRADRCISAASLEARVPFGDLDFVEYVMSIPAEKKMNTYNVGKYLLRKAFEEGKFLPHDMLYREKAAFSDAVGHSMVDYLKEWADQKYTDADLAAAKTKYPYKTPFTKESLMYRDIFEEHYPGRAEVIVDFWMPNKSWENCDVDDPSARVLPNYGNSGH